MAIYNKEKYRPDYMIILLDISVLAFQNLALF